jgi:hypothetical protein
VQVSKVVQTCVRYLLVGPDELGHQRRDGIGVDRFAPSGREHVPVLGSAPGVACLELFGGLVGLALAQDGDSLVIDGDDPGPAALGRAVDALAADDGRRAGDLLAVQVDVLPVQVQQFAATCPMRWPVWITAEHWLGVRILAFVHVVRGLVSGGEVTNQDQDVAVV